MFVCISVGVLVCALIRVLSVNVYPVYMLMCVRVGAMYHMRVGQCLCLSSQCVSVCVCVSMPECIYI
jgi:hypothetical protein